MRSEELNKELARACSCNDRLALTSNPSPNANQCCGSNPATMFHPNTSRATPRSNVSPPVNTNTADSICNQIFAIWLHWRIHTDPFLGRLSCTGGTSVRSLASIRCLFLPLCYIKLLSPPAPASVCMTSDQCLVINLGEKMFLRIGKSAVAD